MAAKYFSKFEIIEKFDRLPDEMELDARGELRLDRTEIDMIPAGLKGVSFVILAKEPLYVAPDFKGIVMYYDSNSSIVDMDKLNIEAAKARYNAHREMVEKPRYIYKEDGSLSLCSLPTNMRVFHKKFEGGYCLDLTQTSIREKQNLGGFREIILYPKKPIQQEFTFSFPKKICRHKENQKTKSRIYE